jgi:hypothetical protein
MTMSAGIRNDEGFDTAAAVTRSLLGWGVVVGPFYLVLGITLALTRPGFDLATHPLSLLMLGDYGWIQTTNLILSGLMTLAAALGFVRAQRGTRAARWSGALVGAYGLCLVASGIFPPDPMAGFPAGAPQTATVSGILHFAFGAFGFLAFAASAVVMGGWFAGRGDRGAAWYSRISGAVVIVGFFGGAVVGTGALWLAVVVGWAWLLVASVRTYRTVPPPDANCR